MQNINNFVDYHEHMNNIVKYLHERTRPDVGDYKWSCKQEDFNGWVVCDGRTLSRTQYPDLFDILGSSFGSSCGNTFRLPDYRGKIMGGIGEGNGLTARSFGDDVGSETHTLSENEMPPHTHTGTTATAGSHAHTTNATGGQGSPGLVIANGANTIVETDSSMNELNLSGTGIALNVAANGDHTHTFTTNSTGGSNAHNNMQPTLFGGNVFVYAKLY